MAMTGYGGNPFWISDLLNGYGRPAGVSGDTILDGNRKRREDAEDAAWQKRIGWQGQGDWMQAAKTADDNAAEQRKAFAEALYRRTTGQERLPDTWNQETPSRPVPTNINDIDYVKPGFSETAETSGVNPVSLENLPLAAHQKNSHVMKRLQAMMLNGPPAQQPIPEWQRMLGVDSGVTNSAVQGAKTGLGAAWQATPAVQLSSLLPMLQKYFQAFKEQGQALFPKFVEGIDEFGRPQAVPGRVRIK